MSAALPQTAQDIAGRLGLWRSARGWRGDCPSCGYRDSFIVSGRAGPTPRAWCVSCGHADAGSTPAEHPAPPHTRVDDEDRTRKALATWNGAVPIAGTPAEQYLRRRGIQHLVECPALRWRADVAHPEVAGRHPAMLALIQDADGRSQAIHRHYLTQDGSKAPLAPAKASSGVVRGGYVQLAPIAEQVVVGEGVESSAAAGQILGLPALAAISAGNLGWTLVLPPQVRSVVIAADHDPVARTGKRPGHVAAHAALRRWTELGLKVRIAMPDLEGEDFADILAKRRGGENA